MPAPTAPPPSTSAAAGAHPATSPPMVAESHPKTGTVTTGTLAAILKGDLIGPPDLVIRGLAALDQSADDGQLGFIRSGKFAAQWTTSRASAALVSKGVDVPGHDPSRRALIIVENADLAMAHVLAMFEPRLHQPGPGVHPSAVVDPSAQLGQGVCIGPFCVVGPRTRIGDGTVLMTRVTVGADVKIGPLTTMHPGVVIYDRCVIGAKCILHGNVVIGADGFGYLPDPQGRGLLKIPHVGLVEIGNAVEIGACSCIDRGKFGATTIGDGTKIDNHVQIGHNARIGRSCIICGMCGIAGSVVLEDGVILAGSVGVIDGKRIGARATVSAKSGVMDDIPPGETWFGTPAGPHKDQMRSYVALRQLSKFLRDVKRQARDAARGGGSGQ